MSSHEETAESADGHGGHDHAIFDAEPTTELAAGEPTTPLWLPLLGAALFVLFGLYLTVDADDDAAGAAGPASASSSAIAAVAAAPAAPPARAPRPRTPSKDFLPSLNPSAQLNATPEQIQRIRDNLAKARREGRVRTAKSAAGSPPPAPPARRPAPPAPKAPAPRPPAPKAPAPRPPQPSK